MLDLRRVISWRTFRRIGPSTGERQQVYVWIRSVITANGALMPVDILVDLNGQELAARACGGCSGSSSDNKIRAKVDDVRAEDSEDNAADAGSARDT